MLSAGIDADGTIFDTYTPLFHILKERHDIHINIEQLTEWYLPKNPQLAMFTEPYLYEIFKEIWSDPRSIKLVDERVPEIIRNLKNRFDLHLITMANAERHQLDEALKHNNIDMDVMQVKSAQGKIASSMDVLVDDDPHVADSMCTELGRTVILLRRSWNERFSRENAGRRNLMFASDWEDVEKKMTGIHELRARKHGSLLREFERNRVKQ